MSHFHHKPHSSHSSHSTGSSDSIKEPAGEEITPRADMADEATVPSVTTGHPAKSSDTAAAFAPHTPSFTGNSSPTRGQRRRPSRLLQELENVNFQLTSNQPQSTSVASATKWAVDVTAQPRSNPLFSDAFLRAIPKVDLHLHLDGSIRLSTLIDLAKEQKVELPAYTVEELKETVFKPNYRDLPEYLQCFTYTVAVLQTASALERVSYELGVDNFTEGVRYVEVRFAPQLHVSDDGESGLEDIASVLLAVNRGLSRAAHEFNQRIEIQSGEQPRFQYAIIVCALRNFNKKFSDYYCHFCHVHQHEPERRIVSLASMALVSAVLSAKKQYDLPVVALDIAGAESGYPAVWHAEAFATAHKNFLRKTVHAGEGHGPESIFQAITDLHAERIGHGFHLFSTELVKRNDKIVTNQDAQLYVDNLVQYIADRRITVEVCLSSNLQTMPDLKGDLRNHHLRLMLENRLSVSLGTDNRTVSDTCVCKEYRLAVDYFELTPKQLKDISIAGFKRCFFPGSYREKRQFVRDVIDYYQRVEEENGLQSPPYV